MANANNKNNRVIRKMRTMPTQVIDPQTLDRNVIDTVLKTLYNNADIDALQIDEQIYKANNISLSKKDSERMWEVLISSGWISPVIGFGNSGKVSLTREGYKLMAQFGSYIKYLEAVSAPQQQQTIIMPIQYDDDKDPEITPPVEKGKKGRK